MDHQGHGATLVQVHAPPKWAHTATSTCKDPSRAARFGAPLPRAPLKRLFSRTVPSDKRERQRANRQKKQVRLQRIEKRRKYQKRALALVVVIAVIVGIVFLTKIGGKSKSATSTTGAPGTPAARQAAAIKADLAAGCPGSPTAPVKKKSWTSPPPMTINTSETYTATVKTDAGSFTIALDAKAAPVTVNNFLFLASSQFYNCVSFHRVIPGFMDQTGDPTGTGSGGPGYKFADENIPKSLSYTTGEVAMANSGANTNGSQFFVLAAPYS
ncbi:MAG TPA: peptidylprolyl isomerase, partial [Acidimicrobiales bacterium]|nr:peptidylprolyl isomerase [Acidimicrobiales bacterium]